MGGPESGADSSTTAIPLRFFWSIMRKVEMTVAFLGTVKTG